MSQSEGAAVIAELAAEWIASYLEQSANAVVDVHLGTYTYSFDVGAERLVCAVGHSSTPQGPRDANRQRGHPPAPKGDHKGHVFAHSMGGGMDINIVPQLAAINLGREWRAIETLAAEHPGTAVAVHLIYADDSQRPAAFEYGFEHPETGFQLHRWENFASEPLALCWSGGKDSALALHAVRSEQGLQPQALITTVTEGYERISMHGVRRSLLTRQAEALEIPLVEIRIPPSCVNKVYEQRMGEAFASEDLRAVERFAFGDLFLEDIRAYREERLSAAGKRAIFPLWERNTADLAHEFIDAGFQALVVCVDPMKLDPSFAGRSFDERFLEDLPADVDPCGENGEFHTFVHAGPIFAEPITCEVGEVVEREGFVFCDVLAA